MITNTKVLFSSVVKSLAVDCVCDIGSRDGDQALLFRHICPSAAVMAFEANPINYETMAADARLIAQNIQIYPFAVSNVKASARFHITNVDYTDPRANKGTSSLLTGKDIAIKDSIEVETCRIDDFVASRFPEAKRVALWIDVEGAEFNVLDGMAGIKDKVVAVHVETSRVPLRDGQQTLHQLSTLMDAYGFALSGSNMGRTSEWGDVVFVNRAIIRNLGFRFFLCRLRGYLGYWVRADHAAVVLKSRWPAGYRFFRRVYLKVGT